MSNNKALGRKDEMKRSMEMYDPETRTLTRTDILTVTWKVPEGVLPSERKLASEMTDQDLSTFFQTLWPATDLLYSEIVVTDDEKEYLYGKTGLYWPPRPTEDQATK